MPYPPEYIEEYVLENWLFFGPRPEGIGWISANQCIESYIANNRAFARDLVSVEALQEKKLKDDEKQAQALKESRGEVHQNRISPELKADIEQIQRMHRDGYSVEDIVNATGFPTVGIRNALNLKGISPSEISDMHPGNDVIARFVKTFGATKSTPKGKYPHIDKRKINTE